MKWHYRVYQTGIYRGFVFQGCTWEHQTSVRTFCKCLYMYLELRVYKSDVFSLRYNVGTPLCSLAFSEKAFSYYVNGGSYLSQNAWDLDYWGMDASAPHAMLAGNTRKKLYSIATGVYFSLRKSCSEASLPELAGLVFSVRGTTSEPQMWALGL